MTIFKFLCRSFVEQRIAEIQAGGEAKAHRPWQE